MSVATDAARRSRRMVGRVLKRSETFHGLVRRRYLSARRPRWDFSGRDARVPASTGARRRVLLGTNIGGYLNGLSMESTLAQALLARGHDVHVLLCDAVLPACLECTHGRLESNWRMATDGPSKRLCPGCFATGRRTYDDVGAQVHSYSSLLTDVDRSEAVRVARGITPGTVADLKIDGVALGEHALAGTLRYLSRATLEGEPYAEDILRRYAEAAVLTARATERLLASYDFDVVVFHHGIYVPQGIVGEVCRREGVRVVNWNPAYRKHTFIFSHGDTYHHTLMTEPTETWESLGWDDERERLTMDYLQSRWSGTQDWIWFHERPEFEVREIEKVLGVDLSKPTIGLLTNVMWDAQLHYPANAFPNMRDWVVDTVRWFADHPELQLLIRVHPAEITGTIPSRQLVADELRRAFPQLPANVFLVGPESSVSTYAVMGRCDSVIIFGTKTGVELTSMGIPVVVAGEAWIRGKGVTIDVSSRDEYLRVLERLPLGQRMPQEQVRRARQYAYHFFFRRMIPLQFMAPTGDDPVFMPIVSSAVDLMPGRSVGLDVILDGILEGTPFVYPADEDASLQARRSG